MSALQQPRSSRWVEPRTYAKAQAMGQRPTPAVTDRNSQQAFERAVARELSGDCC